MPNCRYCGKELKPAKEHRLLRKHVLELCNCEIQTRVNELKEKKKENEEKQKELVSEWWLIYNELYNIEYEAEKNIKRKYDL